MGTTDNVLRRRGGVARSDDRRLAELAREWFADTAEVSRPDTKNVAALTRGRKKRPANGSEASEDFDD